MDLSLMLLDEELLCDSLLASQPEANDNEVTQILKKWKKDILLNANYHQNSRENEFDSRTFTRKRRTNDAEISSIESGIASINLQVGGLNTRSWLNEESPPSSICTSMDFQNCDMLNSLITSSDFSNVSFLSHRNEENITIENITPTRSFTKNLMDFTFDISKAMPSNSTFTANVGENLTFDASGGNQNELNKTIIQSTPVHANNFDDNKTFQKTFDHALSPISSSRRGENEEKFMIRNLKARNIAVDVLVDDYRNSMEDQCEFLLNEETIKLSSRVCGDTFECVEMKAALIQSTDANEKEFDKMLESFNVKKSLESEKLLQSVDNIKQRHSLINFEKQREEKQKKDIDGDNKAQYDTLNRSGERLLRRSRLYDDNINLLLQKQHTETSPISVENEDSENLESVVDTSNRDRFKTIKLNKKLQSGMVVVDSQLEQINKVEEKQDNEVKEFKRPSSKISKFGFTRPTYRSRNDLHLPLKAGSTDSLDNEIPQLSKNSVSNLKSPMGIKSKSIHNLIGNSGSQNSSRLGSYSNLKSTSGATKSQSNLKTTRASSLVRPLGEYCQKQSNAPASRKTLVRPSSAYYGNNTKRLESDTESGCSLSSSSASSRNSIHISTVTQQFHPKMSLQTTEVFHSTAVEKTTTSGTTPKLMSGLRPPTNIRAPQARSGLPRPSIVKR